MPHDLDAEAAVLAAMLDNDAETSAMLRLSLTPEDFYDPKHSLIFSAALGLMERKSPVDSVTVPSELRRRGQWAGDMDDALISQIRERDFQGENAAYYAAIVRHESDRCRIIKAAREVEILARADTGFNSRELATQASQRLFNAVPEGVADGPKWYRAGSLFEQALRDMETRSKFGNGLGGLSTGYDSIDGVFMGLTPGDMYVIAARPSMGKSALLQNIGQNVARNGHVVGFFSAEMSRMTVVNRLISSVGKINGGAVRTGVFSADDSANLCDVTAQFFEAPFYIDDLTRYVNLLEQRAVALRAEAGGLDLILVDYLQYLHGVDGKRYASEREQVSDITKSLKSLAKKMNVPIIVAAQINRGVEGRENKRPQLSDLADSGKIEQEADVIAFLYRASYYERNKAVADRAIPPIDPDAHRITDDTEIIVSKFRNGQTGWAKLDFRAEFTLFDEMPADDRGGYYRDED